MASSLTRRIPLVSRQVFHIPLFWIFLFCLLFSLKVTSAATEVKIGILAKRGPDVAIVRWMVTADYLTKAIPGYTFTIVPFSFSEMHAAAQDGKVDFVLTNPSMYVELEAMYGVSRIATLINQNLPGQQTTVFGGVIFTRADRNDINNLQDILA